jgi:hypothetical protein
LVSALTLSTSPSLSPPFIQRPTDIHKYFPSSLLFNRLRRQILPSRSKMDLSQELVRSCVRSFYDTKLILIIDALIIHSAYVS